MEKQQPQKQPQNNYKSIKTKLCLFFGYNGQQFQGMQFQRQHQNTIQNILHKMLVEKGFILKTNANQLKRIKWSRAARTDKKVHALCNAVSLKLQIYPQYLQKEQNQIQNNEKRKFNFDKMIKDMNQDLPLDIRIFAIKKVGKNFDVRQKAFSRVYNYIVPSRLFQSYKQFSQGKRVTGQQLEKTLEKINQLVQVYLGTHNFHNFTRGYKRTDPRCQRYLISMKAQHVQHTTIETYINKHKKQKQGQKQQQKQLHENQKQKEIQYVYEDFIRFTLIGQSFIYHQIRKMIGMIVKVFTLQLQGKQHIKKALKQQGYQTFLAPGQGLYLNTMTFDFYNKKQGIDQKLQFNQVQQQRMIKYRAYLQQQILNHQFEKKVFSEWLTNRFQKNYEQKADDSQQQKSVNNQ